MATFQATFNNITFYVKLLRLLFGQLLGHLGILLIPTSDTLSMSYLQIKEVIFSRIRNQIIESEGHL